MTSLWEETAGPVRARAPLAGDATADVVVLGGGYSGLWTALHLLDRDPALDVLVVEARHVGFGASGRNGGWFSSKVAGIADLLADPATRDGGIALQRLMIETVADGGRFLAREGIECDWVRSGTVDAATSPAQEALAKAYLAVFAEAGFGDDFRWAPAEEMAERFRPAGLRGGYVTPHTASVHPLKLVRGLAAAVERRGGRIVEGTTAELAGPGAVRTDRGTVRAPVVIHATEAYSGSLPGRGREVAPVYSLMVATAPLPAEVWEVIGLPNRETFADWRRLIVYGQRTADDRIAFGGRGAPYHYGSAIDPAFDTDQAVAEALVAALRGLFPDVADHLDATHHWGGPLGVPRDWRPSVRFDPTTGVGSLGGYVGQGVAASALAGRSMAALVLGHDDDEAAHLPWVGHRSPRWEPEPLRWLGVNAGLALTKWTDDDERRTGREARLRGAVIHRLVGL
ncbi:MAG: FAD-dependent oxidoreductase [Acidimicrobiia bacterium]